MTDHILCLMFDHDNTSLAITDDRISPVMLSRGDCWSMALPHPLTLLERAAIPATFLMPGHTEQSYLADIEPILHHSHKIGHHGRAHRVPSSLGRDSEAKALTRGQRMLPERLIDGLRAGGATFMTMHDVLARWRNWS